MAYVCPPIKHHTDFQYRLVQIIQKTSLKKVLTHTFGVLRTQLGMWMNKGKEMAWHWGIQVRRKGSSDIYCSIGLKKSASNPMRTEMTSPDVYDGPKCWRKNKDMGCIIREDYMSWTPLNKDQKNILNLCLRTKPIAYNNLPYKTKIYKLPFTFSYLAHYQSSKSMFNCNKFANHFHTEPKALYDVLHS